MKTCLRCGCWDHGYSPIGSDGFCRECSGYEQRDIGHARAHAAQSASGIEELNSKMDRLIELLESILAHSKQPPAL